MAVGFVCCFSSLPRCTDAGGARSSSGSNVVKQLSGSDLGVHAVAHGFANDNITQLRWWQNDMEIIATSDDSVVALYDVVAGRSRRRQNFPTATPPHGISPLDSIGGSRALAVGSGRAAYVWDTAASFACINQMPRFLGATGRVVDVETTSSLGGGTLVLTAALDGHVRGYDLRKPGEAALFSLVVDPDPRYTALREITSVYLDHATQSKLAVYATSGLVSVVDLHQVASLGFDPDVAQSLSSVSQQSFEGPANNLYLRRATWCPDDVMLGAGSDCGDVYIWNSRTGGATVLPPVAKKPPTRLDPGVAVPIGTAPPGSFGPVLEVHFCPRFGMDGLVAVAHENGLRLWQAPVGSADESQLSATVPERSDTLGTMHVRSGLLPQVEGERADAELGDADDFEDDDDSLDMDIGSAQRSLECRHGEGYVYQEVYICLTCIDVALLAHLTPEERAAAEPPSANLANVPPGALHGMCYGCHALCHRGHDTHQVGFIRDFRCDCGNSKFAPGSEPCCTAPGKAASNPRNIYTDQFRARYCICRESFNGQLMVMCTECTDWFHWRCIGMDPYDYYIRGMDYLCHGCLDNKLPWLHQYAFDPLPRNPPGDVGDEGPPAIIAGPRSGAATPVADELVDVEGFEQPGPSFVPRDTGSGETMGYALAKGRFLRGDWRSSLREAHTGLAPVHVDFGLPEGEVVESSPNASSVDSQAAVAPAGGALEEGAVVDGEGWWSVEAIRDSVRELEERAREAHRQGDVALATELGRRAFMRIVALGNREFRQPLATAGHVERALRSGLGDLSRSEGAGDQQDGSS